ncbi:S6 family peptidase [Tatumella sp. UBA2305]|uniref:S6 family peptidase n=1 Tax=Tatumella sp. UBA2305 TaxID=1947647 RepID=UPI0025FED6F4|nr:S6 family peptidase [Tatumella sp. UBA2305]
MKRLSLTLLCSASMLPATGNAGIMREDVPVQEYRDFAENLGKYRPGRENISVLKKDGSVAGILQYPMPDFSAVNSTGYATVISPSYIVSVRHNGGYNSVDFGNNALYKTKYLLINRNESTERDFHVPRLNKVVTEAAPVPGVKGTELAANKDRYQWYARVGGGRQYQVDAETQTLTSLAGAYQWKSGGTMTDPTFENWRLRWYNYAPDDPRVQPLDSLSRSGDSGSPMFVYDNLEQVWKIAGVLTGSAGTAPYQLRSYILFLQDAEISAVQQKNTDPAVTDQQSQGDILWSADQITQGNQQWQWHGVDTLLPSQASNAQLDASKDLQFNGDGGTIVLQQAVNHGAAKLQFSADYKVTGKDADSAHWVGGGVEVDENATVDWQVNGRAGDTLHKIGAGTLWVHASGENLGALNTGDGTVILDQRADADGKKQAFSSVTLVSGRPTVILNSADQVSTENIQFGYRGGTLDMNGQSLSFSEIKHNDNGARLLNNNAGQVSELTLTGNNQSFAGSLGDAQAAGKLNVTTENNWTLSGGAYLAQLTADTGTLSLGGEQVLHAGGVVYSNDWQEKTYTAEAIRTNNGATLILAEHATLNSDIVLSDSFLQMQSRTTLDGSLQLSEGSYMLADISQRISTQGEISSQINASVSGQGILHKSGEGRLTLTGDATNSGGIQISGGDLEVRSTVSGPVRMGSDTTLSGAGSFGEVTSLSEATFNPGKYRQSDNEWSVMKIGKLVAGRDNQLILNSAFTKDATDRLLIEGDLVTADDSPLMVSIYSQSGWQNSDTNNNNHADNNEGISLVQVGGSSTASSVKLAGGYVARGAWAYDLYAFAPGKSASGERLLTGEGNQYWDYRLQNILLNSEGNTEPAVDPVPSPEPSPSPSPTPVPDPVPSPVPSPLPVRPATTPQVASYVSLPAAFRNFSDSLQDMFSDSVRDPGRGMFVYGYHSEDRYHSAGGFSDYGYNFTSKSNGWMLGSRWQFSVADQQVLSTGLAVSKGSLSVKPSAADGFSHSNFNTLGVHALLRWLHPEGWWLESPVAYTRFRGDISTDLRGQVARPKAGSWLAGLDAGKRWQFGAHSISPLLGIRWQYQNIDAFTDEDQAQVSYRMQYAPDISTGVSYQLDLGALVVGADVRVTHRPGKAPQLIVSDGQTASRFNAGRGGDSVQLKTDAALSLTPQTRLTTRLQYQKRLEKEGIDDWNILGGLEVSF